MGTTAVENGNFNTLVAALDAVDLVGALSAPNGPFTVFAPNDQAFEALPPGVLECLLENPKDLSDILLYHVVSGEAFSTDLSNGQRVPTLLDGASVTVGVNNNGVRINRSDVVLANVRASNGVIHVIDEVLVPGRVDIQALCRGSSNSMTGTSNNNKNNQIRRPACHYGGHSVHAHEWLTGPTHTCYCQPDGRWTHCRLNHNVYHHQHGQWNNNRRNNNGWSQRWNNYWYGH